MVPASHSVIPCRRMRLTTDLLWAPSAIRMPISAVLSCTEYAISPYSPKNERKIEIAPNTVRTAVWKRRPALASDTNWAIVRTLATPSWIHVSQDATDSKRSAPAGVPSARRQRPSLSEPAERQVKLHRRSRIQVAHPDICYHAHDSSPATCVYTSAQRGPAREIFSFEIAAYNNDRLRPVVSPASKSRPANSGIPMAAKYRGVTRRLSNDVV